MTDRPILFSATMVSALRAGTKTQTRRTLSRANVEVLGSRWGAKSPWDGLRFAEATLRPHSARDLYLPFCHPEDEPTPSSECGIYRLSPVIEAVDRLWVRESFSGAYDYDIEKWPPSVWFKTDPIWYWADGNPNDGDWTKPKPSIHMPRWASRLTLTVTGVKVERLQDISDEDAQAEGAFVASRSGRFADSYAAMAVAGEWFATARGWSANLWDRINGPGAWDANPWVAAILFSVDQRNIDA